MIGLPPTFVRSGAGVLPEEVVGRVRDLDDVACRCGVAFRGRGSEATRVLIRWTKVVSTSRSPSAPGVVVADRSTHGIAVRSTVTLSTTVPRTLLPSFACQVGPAKWLMISLPLSPYRLARGTAELHTAPLHV